MRLDIRLGLLKISLKSAGVVLEQVAGSLKLMQVFSCSKFHKSKEIDECILSKVFIIEIKTINQY